MIDVTIYIINRQMVDHHRSYFNINLGIIHHIINKHMEQKITFILDTAASNNQYLYEPYLLRITEIIYRKKIPLQSFCSQSPGNVV